MSDPIKRQRRQAKEIVDRLPAATVPDAHSLLEGILASAEGRPRALDDERVRQILSLDGSTEWRQALERLRLGDETLTRRTAGEPAVIAVQRMLVFLGYSTAASGAFLIDGDFGRGTNRGVAQFQFDHRLNRRIKREQLCYPCRFNNAAKLITAIPEAKLDLPTVEAMAEAALEAIDAGRIPLGRFEDALFHLNAVHRRDFLTCRKILDRYGPAAAAAAGSVQAEKGVQIRPHWILSIIRQESAGVVRPRFEQHVLSRRNKKTPTADLAELRYQSMSQGLGQVMGFNFRAVGAESAQAMISSPIDEQVLYVARFIAQPSVASVVAKPNPSAQDFRKLAKFYNGPAFETHGYHEKIARWFREFRALMG